MLTNELLAFLKTQNEISFALPNGEKVPAHYHVTEVGEIKKRFIDCGGTTREETVVNLQLWHSYDYNHRLHPEKMANIIALSQDKLGIGNHPIEVEYQGETIGKYGLEIGKNGQLLLTTKETACLAGAACGLPEPIQKAAKVAFELVDTAKSASCCTPGGGCC